jgi:hypothetical protein
MQILLKSVKVEPLRQSLVNGNFSSKTTNWHLCFVSGGKMHWNSAQIRTVLMKNYLLTHEDRLSGSPKPQRTGINLRKTVVVTSSRSITSTHLSFFQGSGLSQSKNHQTQQKSSKVELYTQFWRQASSKSREYLLENNINSHFRSITTA